MDTYFIDRFRMDWLNRLIYWNYLPLSVFTFAQLSSTYFEQGSPEDVAGSVLAILLTVGLVLYPIFVWKGNKEKYTFLMVRKLVLSLVLVFTTKDPTYMIGVTAVMALVSAILVGAYSVEKWKVETKFNSAMEVVQFFIFIMLAVFTIIGDGSSTMGRVVVSWIIVIVIICALFAYLLFSILIFVLWGCKTFRSVDYIEKWNAEE